MTKFRIVRQHQDSVAFGLAREGGLGSMTVWPDVAAFALLWVAIVSIAAALWMEMRLDRRRRRLLHSLKTVLEDGIIDGSAEECFKRVA